MIESMSNPVFIEHIVDLVEVTGYGDLAYAVGTYSEEISIGGADPVEDKGKILGIMKKQPDSSWKIALWSWNSDLPLPE